MLSRKEIVENLLKEGISHETLSPLTDNQILQLGGKMLKTLSEAIPPYTFTFERASIEKTQYDCQQAHKSCMDKVASSLEAVAKKQEANAATLTENPDGVKNIDTDNVGNPDVTIKNQKGKKVKLINDKEEIDSDVVEEWMESVVNGNQGELTKSKLIELVKNIKEEDIGGMTSGPEIMRREYGSKKPRTKLFSSVEQEYAFEQLNKYVLELDGYEIKVDELESGEDPEEDILNLFLESESGIVWDIIIYTDGNIYMDGAPIQDSQDLEEEIREKESGDEGGNRPDNWRELPGYNPEYFYDEDSILGKEEELAETERDVEGAYMGAPVDTEMPVKTPVRTPTTTPTRPGRKRGPFTRPKTTPKPKAGKDKMPEWMGFDDIKSQTENS